MVEKIIYYLDKENNNFSLYILENLQWEQLKFLKYHIVDYSSQNSKLIILKNDGLTNFKINEKIEIYNNFNLELQKENINIILYYY